MLRNVWIGLIGDCTDHYPCSLQVPKLPVWLPRDSSYQLFFTSLKGISVQQQNKNMMYDCCTSDTSYTECIHSSTNQLYMSKIKSEIKLRQFITNKSLLNITDVACKMRNTSERCYIWEYLIQILCRFVWNCNMICRRPSEGINQTKLVKLVKLKERCSPCECHPGIRVFYM